jgi:hypothetical protein
VGNVADHDRLLSSRKTLLPTAYPCDLQVSI